MATAVPRFSPESTITIALPVETFSNLVAGLENAARVFSVPLTKVGSCDALGSLPSAVQCTGVDLLFAIGRACTRPDVLDDPSRLFALFKYSNVISSSTSLRLKMGAAGIDTHKKRVLSDEFGCGMSFVVGTQCFGTRIFLDFSTAVDFGWVKTTAPKSRRPDYVGRASVTSTELILLEAKGTQTSSSYCEEEQIPSGCEQLESVELANSDYAISKRAVVGIALQREDETGDTICYIGDPQSRDDYTFEFTKDVESCILKSHYSRAASLIGDAALSTAIIEKRTTTAVHLVDRLAARRKISGTSLTLISEAGSLTVFAGIDDEVRGLVIEGASLAKIQQAATEASDSFKHLGGTIADGRDGTVLCITRGRVSQGVALAAATAPRGKSEKLRPQVKLPK